MNVTLETPKPHGPKQRMIMNAFNIRGVNEVWVANGTKFGKSIAAGGCMATSAVLKRQALFRWIAPIYSQSVIGYNYCRRMLPGKPFVMAKDSDPSLYFPDLDTRIQFFHGQHPESIEGEAVSGNVLDEAAKMKQEVRAAVMTTRTVTRAPTLFISTPFGKNWFYHGCMQAKEEMEWAIKSGRDPKKIFITAPSIDNPAVMQEVVDEARLSLPDRLFRQYYLAEFVDGGSVFSFLNEAFGGVQKFITDDVWFADSHESDAIYVGSDWAKTNDYSVFTAFNNHGKLVGYKRFNRISYPEQVEALKAFCQEVRRKSTNKNAFVEVLHDKTGVGEAIDDIIAASSFPFDIKGIQWNNSNKEQFVNSLILSLEEKALSLHPLDKMKDELNSFEVSFTVSGKPHYAAPDGMHDDIVMSLVLSNQLFRENRGKKYHVAVINTLEQTVKRIYYNGGQLELD